MPRSKYSRRVGAVGIGLLALALGSLPAKAADPAPAGGAFVPGSGSATGTAIKVGPQTGGLTIAVTFWQSLADFQGEVARASARAVDLGILATALTAPGCNGAPATFKSSDFPQPLNIDSRDADAAKGKTAQQGGAPDDSPIVTSAGRQQVDAEGTPRSHAITTTAAFGIPGVFEVGAGRTEVTTRIIDKVTREALATADFSSISLAGGMVQLKGLHWEAVQRTGKTTTAEGQASVSSIVVGGVGLPIPVGGGELSTVLAPVNALLLGTGISLDPPVFTNKADLVTVQPLRLRIDHSPLGQTLVAPAVTAAQPVRQPVLDAYSQAVDCAAPIGQVQGVGQVGRAVVLPSDIALSALTGTGGLVVELGGGTATTEGNTFADPFADTGGTSSALAPIADTPSTSGDVLGTSITSGVTGGAVESAAPATELSPGPAATLASAPATVPGARGGTAVVMGLLGLLAVAGVALADYLRIRRGARMIPEEL
jgi:hypothetical protein